MVKNTDKGNENVENKKPTDAMSLEELESEIFGEDADAGEYGETKRIDKFYTLYQKQAAFQELIDKENKRIKGEEMKLSADYGEDAVKEVAPETEKAAAQSAEKETAPEAEKAKVETNADVKADTNFDVKVGADKDAGKKKKKKSKAVWLIPLLLLIALGAAAGYLYTKGLLPIF